MVRVSLARWGGALGEGRFTGVVNGPVGLRSIRATTGAYLAAWGQGRSDVDVGGGVFLTSDAGATCSIFQQPQHVYDVTVDPKNPQVIYACGFDAGA
jgi:hypothetical protein